MEPACACCGAGAGAGSGARARLYLDMLLRCFNITISYPPGDTAQLICNSCVTRLRDANSFKQLVLATQRTLADRQQSVGGHSSKGSEHEQKYVLRQSVKEEADSDASHDRLDTNSLGSLEDEFKLLEEDFPSDDDLPLLESSLAGKIRKQRKYTEMVSSKKRIETNKRSLKHPVKEEPTEPKTEFFGESPLRVKEECLEETAASEGAPVAGAERPARRSRRSAPPAEKGSNKKKNNISHDKTQPVTDEVGGDEHKSSPLTERFTHTSNAITLLSSCNATPFKGLHSRGFRCFYCTESFKEPELLRQHTKENHLKDKQFKTSPRFATDDYVLYVDITSLACELCTEKMIDLNSLRTHLTNTHGKKMYTQFGDCIIPFVLRNGAPHDCQKCSHMFDTFVSLERHMNTHYRNFVCDTCGSGYITTKRLKTHTAFSHSTGNFPCASCEKVFTSATKAKKHTESVHMQKNRFSCPQCPQKFFKYFQRQMHLAKEHNATMAEIRCTLCDKIFQHKDSLNKHTRKEHLLERNHACNQCGFTFFTSTALRNHMVSHTGERTYKCEICKKSYARKNTLRQHMRIHNDDRRFTCSVCRQAFVQNCSLKSHVKTHHPDSVQFALSGAC